MKIIKIIIGITIALMIIIPVSASESYIEDTNILIDEHIHDDTEPIEDETITPDVNCTAHVPSAGLQCPYQKCSFCDTPIPMSHNMSIVQGSYPPGICYSTASACLRCDYSIQLEPDVPCNIQSKNQIIGIRTICYIPGQGCTVCSYFTATGPMVTTHTKHPALPFCSICGYM